MRVDGSVAPQIKQAASAMTMKALSPLAAGFTGGFFFKEMASQEGWPRRFYRRLFLKYDPAKLMYPVPDKP